MNILCEVQAAKKILERRVLTEPMYIDLIFDLSQLIHLEAVLNDFIKTYKQREKND